MNKTLKTAIAFVLIGLTSAWFGFIVANYVGLYEAKEYGPNGGLISGYSGLTQPTTYIFLTALISLAAFSGMAYRMTDALVAKKTPGALPVFRFAAVGVVVSLVSLVIFALSCFFASFNNFSGVTNGIGDQLTGVYIPIILAAAVSVFLILSATVYRKSEATVGKASPEQKRAKREAALAFIYPIVGTTLALLIGLTIYQSSRQNPQVWVWVFILAIVGGSIAMGSIYAARTKAHGVSKAKPKKPSGTAALSLNFVLVVVFVVVVTLMSFGFGIAAVSDLRSYDYTPSGGGGSIRGISLDWFIRQMLPAMLTLALVDVTAYVAVRIRSIVSAS
jgi:MFS family permease